MTSEEQTEQSKKELLVALEMSLGIASTACKKASVGRTTHYRWMKEDDAYKRAVREVENLTLDFAESHLHKLIQEGSPAATIFYLKTKGKNRGYVERQEIEVSAKKPLSWLDDE